MRTLVFATALSATLGLAAQGQAQTPLAGPLAIPDASPPASTPPTPTKAKPARHKRVAHHATSAPSDTERSPSGRPAAPVLNARPDPASDPVSLGMKWNGTNDSATQTRVQNYNGNATGTGGEVGLNFHF